MSPTTATPLVRAALAYAGRGWPVLPTWWPAAGGRCACGARSCPSVAKHPLARLVPRGVTHATADVATVRRWWDAYPCANVAVATGARSGLLVLDVDDRAGGDDALADLERVHGALPETVRVTTGNGLHVYFAHPAAPVPNRVGLRPGLDLRSDGGYVVAPPSAHVSGRRYSYEIGFEPGALPLAPPPRWLLELLRDDRRRLTFDGSPLVIRAGERNDHLFAFACMLRRYGLGSPALSGCIEAVNRHHVAPPLDADELRRIAASATRYQPSPRRDHSEVDDRPPGFRRFGSSQ